MTGTDVLSETLRDHGLKVTAGRLAVMDALERSPHAAAEQLFAAVRDELPGTSLQAVYGVLAALADAGLVRRIEPAGSPALYERRVDDNHHHLICSSCHAVQDVDCVVGEAPCLTPSDAAGFIVHAAEVTFWGLCANCQAAASQVEPVETPASPHSIHPDQKEIHV
ncbi:Fur family transcriptional regulator [Diaminobutyricimonas sp. TR449]|uniref:Fur family transcriptional regulator n=1 Tax=Diaminobutyricimonas sp. TR449 TaxID=2708076 RepID=UPI00142280E3|nr:Fur family transcriptional regulator [Diaminobutyricimonas sp. TR449]